MVTRSEVDRTVYVCVCVFVNVGFGVLPVCVLVYGGEKSECQMGIKGLIYMLMSWSKGNTIIQQLDPVDQLLPASNHSAFDIL